MGQFAGIVAGLLVFFIMVSSVFEVIARRVGHPTTWVYDYNLIALLGIVSFALAAVQRDGGHISVQFAVERLPRVPRLIINVFNRILAIFFLAVLAIYGLSISRDSWRAGRTMGGLAPVPAFAVEMMFVIGVTLFLIESSIELYELLARKDGRAQ